MHWITKPVEKSEETGIQRLQHLIRATCLRRTKQQALSSEELKLPRCSERVQEVNLHPNDQALYDIAKEQCAIKAAGLEKRPEESQWPKSRGHEILSLILSLRLICNHGEQLLSGKQRRMIETGSTSSAQIEMPQIHTVTRCSRCDGETDDDHFESMEDYVCTSCIDLGDRPPNATVETGIMEGTNTLVQQSNCTETLDSVEVAYQPSAKVLALLENLKQAQTAEISNYTPRKRFVPLLSLLETISN
jgi:SNF2 family DNA or RNA helicase